MTLNASLALIAATRLENLANFSERAASTRPSHGMVRSMIITSGLQEKIETLIHDVRLEANHS